MTSFNPLAENPAARKVVYSIFWTVGLVLGALQVAFASLDIDATVVTAALATYAFLGAAIGFTAASNTPAPDAENLDGA